MLTLSKYSKWSLYEKSRTSRKEEICGEISSPTAKQVALLLSKIDPQLRVLNHLLELSGAGVPTDEGTESLNTPTRINAHLQRMGEMKKYNIPARNLVSLETWKKNVVNHAVKKEREVMKVDPNQCGECIFDIVKFALAMNNVETTSNGVFGTAKQISKFINERKRGNKIIL